MSIGIKVPAMGESVTEATIARWLKKEGDAVKLDETIVELETDKVSVEVPSPAAGVLEHIEIPQGGTVNVGTVIGQVSEGAVAAKPAKPEPKPAAAPATKIEKPAVKAPVPAAAPIPPPPPSVRRIAEEEKLDTGAVQGSGKRGQVTKADALAALEAVNRQPSRAPRPHRRARAHAPSAKSACRCRGCARPSRCASRKAKRSPPSSPPSTKPTCPR